MDIPAVIMANATVHERESVEAWLRKEMRPEQDSSSTWYNPGIADFLVILKQEKNYGK